MSRRRRSARIGNLPYRTASRRRGPRSVALPAPAAAAEALHLILTVVIVPLWSAWRRQVDEYRDQQLDLKTDLHDYVGTRGYFALVQNNKLSILSPSIVWPANLRKKVKSSCSPKSEYVHNSFCCNFANHSFPNVWGEKRKMIVFVYFSRA